MIQTITVWIIVGYFGHFEHSSGQLVTVSFLDLGLHELFEAHDAAVVGWTDAKRAVVIVAMTAKPPGRSISGRLRLHHNVKCPVQNDTGPRSPVREAGRCE